MNNIFNKIVMVNEHDTPTKEQIKECIDNGFSNFNVSSGSVTMNGGAIQNNKARHGAAVVLSGGTFTMEDGNISNNTCTNGFVISGAGSFVWNGGTISGNKNGPDADGGGVFGEKIKCEGTINKDRAS